MLKTTISSLFLFTSSFASESSVINMLKSTVHDAYFGRMDGRRSLQTQDGDFLENDEEVYDDLAAHLDLMEF